MVNMVMPSNRHSGAVGNSMPQFPLHALSLKLEGHADLVSSLVEVLTVDDRRQGEGDTWSELLLVSQADLARVVDLGPDVGVPVEGVLAADAEVGRVVRGRPAEVHRRLQLVVDALVHASPEDLAVVDVGVQDEVLGGVADAEVVL